MFSLADDEDLDDVGDDDEYDDVDSQDDEDDAADSADPLDDTGFGQWDDQQVSTSTAVPKVATFPTKRQTTSTTQSTPLSVIGLITKQPTNQPQSNTVGPSSNDEIQQAQDPYFAHFDPRIEHQSFKDAQRRLEETHREKV